MLKIHLVWVGKTREAWLRQGIDHYLDRLRRYLPVRVSEVRPVKKTGRNAGHALRNEAMALARAVSPGAHVIAMDVKGKMLDSPGLAALLTGIEDRGARELAMLIGGDRGLGAEILDQADMRLSLSPLTFTHEMARLILVEQLYRACTIRAGQPYHH